MRRPPEIPRLAETPRPAEPGAITRLLRAWHAGDEHAQSELWEVLYSELKTLARGVLRRHGRGRQGQGTSLVHKAYLRLLDTELEWGDRRHFFAVASRAMRFVLVDEARRQLAKKRGEGETLALDAGMPEVADPLAHRPEEVLAVHQALGKLAERHTRHEKLVELRYFAGLSVEETANILSVTPRTVVRDWRAVRLWLHGELADTA